MLKSQAFSLPMEPGSLCIMAAARTTVWGTQYRSASVVALVTQVNLFTRLVMTTLRMLKQGQPLAGKLG